MLAAVADMLVLTLHKATDEALLKTVAGREGGGNGVAVVVG
jgi:hypothetical protein